MVNSESFESSQLNVPAVKGDGVNLGIVGTAQDGWGVSGESKTQVGVRGHCEPGWGVAGDSKTGVGVRGECESFIGVSGVSKTGIGVHGKCDGLAGLFEGNVDITGNLKVKDVNIQDLINGISRLEDRAILAENLINSFFQTRDSFEKRLSDLEKIVAEL